MKATEFDRKFDDGEDMGDEVDWSRAKRPNTQAKRLGVTRQSLIKLWIAERLERA